MKKYLPEQKILYVFSTFAVLALILAVLPPITTNSVAGAGIFALIFLFFGLVGTKFSYAQLEYDTFTIRFLLFSRKTVKVEDLKSIKYLPTWRFQKSLKSIYIDYEGQTWWPLELKNSMYLEETLVEVVKDLKRQNPSIQIDEKVQELLRKYESSSL